WMKLREEEIGNRASRILTGARWYGWCQKTWTLWSHFIGHAKSGQFDELQALRHRQFGGFCGKRGGGRGLETQPGGGC
ncbi:hypothetical protein E2320_013803, partial [Naja naja]